MDEAKRLMQVSWWEGLVVGKTGSCFGRQGLAQLLSKTLTWLSADGWSCPPFLVCLWPEMTRTSMVGLVVTSKRNYTKGDIPRLMLPGPLSLGWAPPDPRLHRRPSNTSGWFWFSLLWSHCSFPLSRCLQDFVCALQDWSLFPPALWKSCNQIPLAFKVRFPGDSTFFCWVPRLESLRWVLNLHNCGRTSLVLLFSSLWVTHLVGMWFDFIVIASSYDLTAASSLSLDMGYLFLVGSSVFLLMVVQQLVVVLLLSQEEISACPSTLPSWTGRLILS